MPAGTIALTNGSNAVTGTGTSFTTELKQGDFVYVTVGSAPYTLVVSSVTSNTQLTLSVAFDGPTTSGLAWNAVPASMQVAITQKILNDFAQVARGRILDFQNWQKIYSSDQSVTVTRPDRTTFSGPSWGYIANKFNNLGDAAYKNTGSVPGTLAAGDDSRIVNAVQPNTNPTFQALELSSAGPFIDFHYQSTSDNYSVRAICSGVNILDIASLSTNKAYLRVEGGYCCRSGNTGAYGTNRFNYFWNSSSQMEIWVDSSRIGAITVASVSDKQLKKDIKYYDKANALKEVLEWKPATFKMKARGIIAESETMLGFIANDLVTVSKECVKGDGLPDDYDIEKEPNEDGAYSLDQVAMIAKLTMAIQGQQDLIDSQNKIISELQQRMKAIDGLDA